MTAQLPLLPTILLGICIFCVFAEIVVDIARELRNR